MRIVIISDSLGSPRPEIDPADSTRYQDVYGYKIREHFKNKHEVDICYIEALDSQDAVLWSQKMVAFREPDVAIFHMGINDSVPRLFKKKSKSILLSPWFRKLTNDMFMKVLHNNRYVITKYFPKTYVTPEQFKANFEKILAEVKKYNPHVTCIGISICFTTGDLLARCFNIHSNIAKFNGILKGLFGENYIEVNSLVEEGRLLITDGKHLTKEGHQQLANELIKYIEDIDSRPK